MMNFILLIISFLLLVLSAIRLIRLIKITERKILLIILATAIGLIAISLFYAFIKLFHSEVRESQLGIPEIFAILISFFMFLCVISIDKHYRALRKLFDTFKSSEDELLKNQELLETILDSTSDGSFYWDMMNDTVFYSPRYCAMLGYELEDFIGLSYEDWKKLVHPDDIDNLEKVFRECFSGKVGNFSSEFRMKTKKGEWFWVQSRGKVVDIDREKGLVRIVGSHMDINERKKTDQKLHLTLKKLEDSEERLRLKLKYIFSPDIDIEEGIILTDLFDLKYLQEVQDTFAEANEVASIITDIEGNPITKPSNFCDVCKLVRETKEGLKRCVLSDKKLGEKAKKMMKPTYEQCHSCGFADASAPIIVGGRHIANWMIGQTNPMRMDENHILNYAREIGADVSEMMKAYRAMPKMTLYRFEKVLELLWMFAEELSTLGFNNFKLTRELEQRKKAEEQMLENERKYLSLIDNLPGVSYRCKNIPEWPMEYISDGCYDLLGVKSEVLMKHEMTYNEFIHYDDQQKVWNQVQEALEKRSSFVLEYRVIHIDGTEKWVWERGHGVYDEDGKLVALEGFITDITERKNSEIRLFRSAERYNALIAATNTGAWEYLKDIGFLWCSPEYFSMLGRDIDDYDITPQRNIEEVWINLIHPEDKESARKIFEDYLKNPIEIYENSYRMKHKDGHWISILSRGRTLKDKSGNFTNRTVGTHIDVTGLKF